MYRVPRYTISLVREGSVGVEDKIARDSATARDILALVFDGLDREQCVVMVLDAKHQVIGINVVSVGSLHVSDQSQFWWSGGTSEGKGGRMTEWTPPMNTRCWPSSYPKGPWSILSLFEERRRLTLST